MDRTLNNLVAPSAQHGTELDRIVNLPMLDPDWKSPDLSPEFRRPGGMQTLRPIQSKALAFARHFRGLLAPIGVGHGKTLTCALLPRALEAKRPVLLIPPSMRADLAVQWAEYAKHWRLPTNLEILTYEILSQPESTALLTRLRPDLIICDEAHKLSDPKSVRTRRFLRYMHENPEVMFCALSGSFTNRSVRDYAHLAACALNTSSPLPRKWGELEQWAKALDVVRSTIGFGLDDMSPEEAKAKRAKARSGLDRLCSAFDTDDPREAYQRRLRSCPGVVSTTDSGVDVRIEIHKRKFPVPAVAKAWLDYLESHWTTPDGEELEDALAFVRVQRQIACGFYYRWIWPNNVPDQPWLDARAQWHKALRAYLPTSHEGRDSPMLAALACENRPHTVPADLLAGWQAWKAQKEKPEPPKETVWLDPFVVYDAVAWAKAQPEPVLIWYEHTAVGQAIAAVGGYLFADVGPEADQTLAMMREPRTIVLSIDAHGTGKNLQLWRKQLVTTPPANGRIWEQLIGRTHRPGQKAETVEVHVNTHVPCFADSVRNAKLDAEYIEQTLNTPQRLSYAHYYP